MAWFEDHHYYRQGLKIEMIELLYGYHYQLFSFYVSPADVGHTGTSRDRVYIIMIHKRKVRVVHDPYKIYRRIVKTISKHVSTRPRDYLLASQNEILMDAADVARIRKKKMSAPYHSFE